MSLKTSNTFKKASRGRPSPNKSGVPVLTMKQRLMAILQKTGDYLTLPEIYHKMGATTIGEKAGIRGILNRSASDRNGEFVRKSRSTGLYKNRTA